MFCRPCAGPRFAAPTAGTRPWRAGSHCKPCHCKRGWHCATPCGTAHAPCGRPCCWPLRVAAARLLPQPVVLGQRLAIALDGRHVTLQVVGLMDEPMTGATVYVAAAPVSAASTATHWRVQLQPGVATAAAATPLRAMFDGQDWPLARVVTEAAQREVATGHLLVLERTMLAVAALVCIVGLAALASTLATSVAEQRSEFAAMATLGATTRHAVGRVVGEALLIVAASVVPALLLMLALDQLLAQRLGLDVSQPLQAAFAPTAAWLWAGVCLLGAGLATAGPAWVASQVTLCEALAERD
jgi:putative ABC transport system permease protein